LSSPSLLALQNHFRPRRLLVIKPSALGDICHSLPVLEFLGARFPDASIDWVANKAFCPLLRGHPSLSDVIEFDRGASGSWNVTLAWMKLIKRLRSVRYDIVIDMQGLLRSAVMAMSTGCRVRIGPGDGREGSTLFYTHLTPRLSVPTHAVERNWAFARMLGSGDVPCRGRLNPSEAAITEASALLAGRAPPFWILAPGARWVTKRWPVAHFFEIGKRLLENHGGTVVIVGAADETEITGKLADYFSTSCLDLGGKTGLNGLAGLLHLADLVVGNDSGPLHLACALGKVVASPYLCTRIDLTGPYGQFQRAVSSPVSCQGSLFRKCPTKQECMAALEPGILWDAICRSFQGSPPWIHRCP